MADIIQIFREFAASPTGRTVLIVVAVLVLVLVVPLVWRSVKHLVQALLWGLVVLVVVAAGAAAVWSWMKDKAEDPARLEAIERETLDSLRGGWTNISGRLPAAAETNGEAGHVE